MYSTRIIRGGLDESVKHGHCIVMIQRTVPKINKCTWKGGIDRDFIIEAAKERVLVPLQVSNGSGSFAFVGR